MFGFYHVAEEPNNAVRAQRIEQGKSGREDEREFIRCLLRYWCKFVVCVPLWNRSWWSGPRTTAVSESA